MNRFSIFLSDFLRLFTKIILGHKCLFMNRFSIFLSDFLKLLECKKVTRYFSRGVSEQGGMQKGGSKGWYKESIGIHL